MEGLQVVGEGKGKGMSTHVSQGCLPGVKTRSILFLEVVLCLGGSKGCRCSSTVHPVCAALWPLLLLLLLPGPLLLLLLLPGNLLLQAKVASVPGTTSSSSSSANTRANTGTGTSTSTLLLLKVLHVPRLEGHRLLLLLVPKALQLLIRGALLPGRSHLALMDLLHVLLLHGHLASDALYLDHLAPGPGPSPRGTSTSTSTSTGTSTCTALLLLEDSKLLLVALLDGSDLLLRGALRLRLLELLLLHELQLLGGHCRVPACARAPCSRRRQEASGAAGVGQCPGAASAVRQQLLRTQVRSLLALRQQGKNQSQREAEAQFSKGRQAKGGRWMERPGRNGA